MKNKIHFTLLLFLFATLMSFAQDSQQKPYNRSSLYSLYIVHPGMRMTDQIGKTLWELPVPEKFNDHCLSLRLLMAADSKESKGDIEDLEQFFTENQVAKRLVAKWFNRNKETGAFDINLVADRGYYNASQADLNMAMKTVRGQAMLADAGEQLIPNTFVVVSDVTYVDKKSQAETAAGILNIIGDIASLASGISNMSSHNNTASSTSNLVKSMSDLGGSISNMVAGFTVKMNSHLFQLVWDESTAATFYNQYYFNDQNIDDAKKSAFEEDENTFKLKYIGSYSAISDKTVMRGIKNDEEVFRKVLARSIDKNIVKLQKEFDVFKVVIPIYKVQNDKILAQIGLKEGVSPDSKYEVIERVEDADGNISYQRKGIIQPEERQIWDNRYMAVEEEATNANLNFTTFKVISGSGFYPGMLLREIKF